MFPRRARVALPLLPDGRSDGETYDADAGRLTGKHFLNNGDGETFCGDVECSPVGDAFHIPWGRRGNILKEKSTLPHTLNSHSRGSH